VDFGGNDPMKNLLVSQMAEPHLSVDKISEIYYETQHRYNYVTPKSFLELISFFKYLLGKKKNEVQSLDVGISYPALWTRIFTVPSLNVTFRLEEKTISNSLENIWRKAWS